MRVGVTTTITGLGCPFQELNIDALFTYGISPFRIGLPYFITHTWRKPYVLARSEFGTHSQRVTGPFYTLDTAPPPKRRHWRQTVVYTFQKNYPFLTLEVVIWPFQGFEVLL